MAEIVGFNAMQANLGLLPNSGQSPVGYPTPSAGDTALRLSQEANQRMSQAQQSVSIAAAGGSPVATSLVGNQFQQRMQDIQSQQMMSPYAAQMMAQRLPGAPQYQQGYMPSPLMMTPANTGVFRPPSQPMMSPIAPMTSPFPSMSPFQPQMPSPMFRSPYEQQAQAGDIWSNRAFSYASQMPGVAGQAVGIGGAAMLGSRIGGALGPWGRAAGAIGGAAAAIGSGFAGGMGQMFQTSMRGPTETRQMGAALQNMTQGFVVGGPQVHAMGRGLSQSGAMDLAGGMRDMAGDSGFQQQTGGMFNRQDLMQMVRRGGEAGLFDMAQSVPQIKQTLRQTAVTIKQFMELTHDPDITNVIREMGRLRQYGMNQQDMVSAAQGMKTYSRMAGTTMQGIQEIGGLPGAMTFQQAGLTAGTGFNYGNYAAGAARQAVAGGGISPRQLALMGGVQGMTQRDIQAQASFSSMPLFGAANAQFGAGGWSAGGPGVGTSGAPGMVQNALGNLNAGIRQGGIGALAMYPLQQRELMDQATANMTPEQLQAQRFGSAMETGRFLNRGQGGMGAFAMGARAMYGDEVAEQMMYQARDPEHWRGQRQNIRARRMQLGISQAAATAEAEPGIFSQFARRSGLTGVAGQASRDIRGPFEGAGRFFGGIGEEVSNWWEDEMMLPDGMTRVRKPKSASIDSAAERAAVMGTDTSGFTMNQAFRRSQLTQQILGPSSTMSALDRAGLVSDAFNMETQGGAGTFAGIAGAFEYALPVPGGFSKIIQGGLETTTDRAAGGFIGGAAETERRLSVASTKRERMMRTFQASKRTATKEGAAAAYTAADKATGGQGQKILNIAAQSLGKELEESGRTGFWSSLFSPKAARKRMDALGRGDIMGAFALPFMDPLLDSEIEKTWIKTTVAERGISAAEAKKEYAALGKDEKDSVKGKMLDLMGKQNPVLAAYVSSEEAGIAGKQATSKEVAMQMTADNFERSRDAIEKSIGVVGTTRLGIDMFMAGGEEFKEMIGSQDIMESVLMTTAATAGSEKWKGSYDKAREMWKQQHGGSTKGFEAAYEVAQTKYAKLRTEDSDVAARFEAAGKRGGAAALEQVAAYGVSMAAEKQGAALRSDEFLGTVGKYMSPEELTKIKRHTGALTGAHIAEGVSTEGLAAMGNAGETNKMRMYMRARAKDKSGKYTKDALAAQQEITRQAVSVAGEGEVEDTAAVSAGGAEAAKLEGAEGAMADMSTMFADFRPAAKEFKEGARLLAEAMASDAIQTAIEGG